MSVLSSLMVEEAVDFEEVIELHKSRKTANHTLGRAETKSEPLLDAGDLVSGVTRCWGRLGCTERHYSL